MKKRILSLLLAFLMLVSISPVFTYAEDGAEPDPIPTEAPTASPCPSCSAIDCDKEHKVCDKCSTVDCTADHSNWCEICKVDNCGQSHIARLDESASGPACNCNAAEGEAHAATCPAYTCPDCGAAGWHEICPEGQEPDETPTEPEVCAECGETPCTCGDEGQQSPDYSGDIGKYAVLNRNLSTYTAYDGTYEFPYYPEDFTDDTVFTISSWRWDAEKNQLWYQLEFVRGSTQGSFGTWTPGTWILQNGSNGNSLIFVSRCGACGEFNCAKEHKWCEVCEDYDCGKDHTTTEPEAPGLSHPESGIVISGTTFPEDVKLSVSPADVSAAFAKYDIPVSKKVFGLDITLLQNGEEYQPGARVKVKVPVNAAPGTKIGLIHNHNGAVSLMGMTEVLPDGTVEFYTDRFSEFAGFTVDFHYNGVDFSINGRTSILLSQLFVELEISEDATSAETVVFSDNTLVSTARQADGDWLLTSLDAFQTNETLIITFTGGRTIVIDVTDEIDYGYDDNGTYHVTYSSDGMRFHFACAAGGGTFRVRLRVYDGNTQVYTERSDAKVLTASTFWVNGSDSNDYWYEVRGSQYMGNVDYTLDGGNKRVIGTGLYNIFSSNEKELWLNRYSREIFGSDNKYCTVWQAAELVMNGDTVRRNVVIHVDGKEVDRKNNVLFPNRDDDSTALAEDLSKITPRSGYHRRGDVGGGATVVVSGNTYNVYLVTSGTVVYNANGGTGAPASQTKYYGVNLTLQSGKPTKSYSTFKGWATSKARADAKTVDYTAGATFTENLTPGSTKTLYAVWDYAAANYTVKHFQQNVAGTGYVEVTGDRQTIASHAHAEVKPAVKSYTGFTSPAVQTVTVNGDGSTVVEYKYDRISYSVTVNKGTGISAVSGGGSYKYGASVTIGATVSTDYEWLNWTGYNTQTAQSYTFTMPAASVTYTANAKKSTYSISYELNGGTVSPENPKSYTSDTATFTLNNPTKTGYTFAGWTGTGLSDKTLNVTIPKGSTGARSYTANWTANEYTLNFDYNGGSNTNSGATTSGPHKAKSGSTDFYEVKWLYPGREGYDFAGWYDAKTGGTQVYYGDTDEAQNPEKDSGICIPGTRYWDANNCWKGTAPLTLYAHWTAKTDAAYTVHYYLKGSTTPLQADKVVTDATFGQEYTESAAAIDGYDLADGEASSQKVTAAYSNNEITFYYKAVVPQYTVSYSYTGDVPAGAPAAPVDNNRYIAGASVNVAAAPTTAPDGYTFSGWTADGVTVNANGQFTMPDGSVTFKGRWNPVDYIITYDLDGGSPPNGVTSNQQTYNVTQALELMSMPEKEGYKFTGWKLQQPAGSWVNDTYEAKQAIPAGQYGDITLVAQWKDQYHYVLSFDANTTDTDQVSNVPNPIDTGWIDEDEHSFALPAGPTRTNYDFLGWAASPDATADQVLSEYTMEGKANDTVSKKLYALWQRQTGDLKLCFNGNASSPAIVTVSGQGLNITLLLTEAETLLKGLPTGSYNITAESGNASYTASVSNSEPQVEKEPTTVVDITIRSKGLSWFTAFFRVKNKCS